MDRASLGGSGGGGGGTRRSRSRGSMTPRQSLRPLPSTATMADGGKAAAGQSYSTVSSSSDGIDVQSALYESIDEGIYDQGRQHLLLITISLPSTSDSSEFVRTTGSFFFVCVCADDLCASWLRF